MKAKSMWTTGAAVVAFVLLSGFRGGGCGRSQGPMSADEVRERSEAALSWFCGEITCTADQKAKLAVDERSAQMTAFAHRATDALVQAHDILTPEQRAKIVEKIRERGERGPAPFGPFGP